MWAQRINLTEWKLDDPNNAVADTLSPVLLGRERTHESHAKWSGDRVCLAPVTTSELSGCRMMLFPGRF